jgi:hypothetical protein
LEPTSVGRHDRPFDRGSEVDVGISQNDCSSNGDQNRRGDFQNQLSGYHSSGAELLPCLGIVLEEEMMGGPPAPLAFFFLTVTPASGLSTIRLKATNVATITKIVAAVLMILLILAIAMTLAKATRRPSPDGAVTEE